ncbi:MAG: hypothetical protein HeimC3_39700 [Candidatus Heimdallarchaeota archaeon LC_3]|nr:MAG: hypothetical protein HeimC3_39700 [Candidatus Heimdallarchaeota archaeon LC_3]
MSKIIININLELWNISMTIICGINGNSNIILGCDSWSYKQDLKYGGPSKKYNTFSNNKYSIGVVSAGNSHVFNDTSKKLAGTVSDYVDFLYNKHLANITSVGEFSTLLSNEFSKELILVREVVIDKEQDEKKKELLRNTYTIYKFLLGGYDAKNPFLEYIILALDQDYQVNHQKKSIPPNALYFDGSPIVKGNQGFKIANNYKKHFGNLNKNQRVIKNYMKEMVAYDIKNNPERAPDYTGRTIGGDLWMLTIRKKASSVKQFV